MENKTNTKSLPAGRQELVTNMELKDNFELVTKSNQLFGDFWAFFAFGIFIFVCAGLVYFLRRGKEKTPPGSNFEIIE